MSYILIRKPGLLTTIQDIGRYGYQKYGVCPSGAMDLLSLKRSNIIVGNNIEEGVLEMTYFGDEILFNVNTIIAITGADMQPKLNGKDIPMYSRININIGDTLKFSNAVNGLRTYLSVYGGFNIEKIMDSKSTYIKYNIGGYKGRRLKAGDKIYLNEKNIRAFQGKPVYIKNKALNIGIIRVIVGPDFYEFEDKSRKDFFEKEYEITESSDRMGYRLKGEKIIHKKSPDIISRGLPIGAIQVSGDNQPIIMMSDRQTIGGYTVIGVVVSVDINKLAQMKPGDRVRFEKISLESAHSLLMKEEKELRELKENFQDDKPYISNDIKNFMVEVNGESYNVSLEDNN